jgi:hypothetical protein
MILKTDKHKETLIELIKEIDLSVNFWSVKWVKYFPKRTLSQNRYYWLILTFIEKSCETGHSKDELHEAFLSKFAPKKPIEVEPNELMMLPKRTKEMDTKEFTDYIEEIIQFVLHFFGQVVPRPEDKDFENFKEYYSNF